MFSFVIITDGNNSLTDIVHSIHENAGGEVIVVGGARPESVHLHIPFDESAKRSWITKKKNLGIEAARHENVVVMHDYIKILPGWTDGWDKFGFDWDVASNIIQNTDGTRWRDWCYWDSPHLPHENSIIEPWCPQGMTFKGQAQLAPYHEKETGRHYVNGTYWVAKRDFMLQFPLNERLGWGQGEDVEWSLRWRSEYYYVFNPNVSIQLTKHKPLGIHP